MNTYVQNYWSLYLDFIHDFQKLKYSGFSLSYIVHFPGLIRNNPEIWKALHDEKFTERLKNQVKDQKEIQEVFNKYIQSHKKKTLVKNKHGKVVVNYDTILRFPAKTFDEYFDRSKTMVIIAGSKNHQKRSSSAATKNKMLYSIPTKYLSNYEIDTKKAVIQLKNQAKAMFKSYKTHHLYKDKNFQKLFLNKIAEIVNCIEQSIRFLDDVSVACIVVPSTHSYISRILALVAAEKGIATICMQHGIIANEFGYIPKIANVDAVYGQYEIDWYEKLGVPKGSLEIIGHPRFDQAFQPSTIKRTNFNKQLGLDNRKKTLMVVVRGNRSIGKWKILLDTISKGLDLNVLIKDFPSKIPNELDKMYPFVHSTQAFDLYDLLPNVDCVVSYTSTVGLEAMLLNKQVFILHSTLPSYTGYFDGLGEVVQKDPKKLGELIVRYFNDPRWGNYLNEKRESFLHYAYPDLSMSGERLNKLINRLTS